MAKLNFNRVGLAIMVGIITFGIGFLLRGLIIESETNIQLLSALPHQEAEPENPYLPYQFSQLQQTSFTTQPLYVLEQMDSNPSYNTYLIGWDVPELQTPTPSDNNSKLVTAQLNVPSGNGPFPIIVMLRGYVEREQYQTGIGTRNAAAALARNGYITIAPDFLGYGGSDAESEDILLARFARPVTVLQLLANLKNPRLRPTQPQPHDDPLFDEVVDQLFASDRIGLWAHSNGGQIALSILEITGQNLPTTLWAPVSKPFPYSILYFSDELEDQGKYIRSQLANFEQTLQNDVKEFSVNNHMNNITAPILIHQGGNDDAVPLEWSQDLAQNLEKEQVEVTLYEYPTADHNLTPNWDQVVQRDLRFFASHLKDN